MAVAVASTATGTSTTTSLVITKPTGLAVGDLLVAALGCYNTTATLPGGWTSVQSVQGGQSGVSIFYKVADSGDVAASNFTFTGGNSHNAGTLFRVTGYAIGVPIKYSQSSADTNANSASIGTTISVTPAVGSLLIQNYYASNGGASGVFSISGYGVTGDSYTWTETHDYGLDLSANIDPVAAAAYTITDSGDALTAYGATISGSREDHARSFVEIQPSVNATGTNDLVTTTSTTFTQSGVCDGIIGNTLATATSQAFTQGGQGTSPTQWTNEPGTTTTWTNEPI